MGEALKCSFHNKAVPAKTWEQARPFLAEAAKYSDGEFTAERLRSCIERGQQELWVVWKEDKIVWTWVTEVMFRNHRKICQVVAAGGTDHEAGWYFWLLMSKWMKTLNISKAEVWCRPSMARLLRKKNPNFKTKYEVLDIKPEVL